MLKRFFTFFVILLTFAILGAIGCQKEEEESGEQHEEDSGAEMPQATAMLSATDGNEAHGSVTFTMTEEGMRVAAHFEDVPAGEHGFHIHEFGDCSSGDGKSAGGHFNPAGNDHAGPSAETRHVGDLGNITADENGVAHKDYIDPVLTFEGENSIIGKGVILHADQDDLTSQPTGAAGARISCGVIEMAGHEESHNED